MTVIVTGFAVVVAALGIQATAVRVSGPLSEQCGESQQGKGDQSRAKHEAQVDTERRPSQCAISQPAIANQCV
jgi:hypothetical protein